MVVTDFKLRYQGSTLGYVWSLLRPLFLFAILYEVFVNFLQLGHDVPHYPVYLLSGIVLWNFFAEVTSTCVDAIVRRGDLIRKINFPKYVVVISVAASALINLLLNSAVIFLFLLLTKVPIGWTALWAPLFIIEILLFALAIGFILSTLFVRLRDISYIWEVVLQAFFYATPIIYPLSLVAKRWPELAKALLLNPVGQAIQDIRYNLITHETLTLHGMTHHWLVNLVPFGIVLAALILAVFLYLKRSPYFAEEV